MLKKEPFVSDLPQHQWTLPKDSLTLHTQKCLRRQHLGLEEAASLLYRRKRVLFLWTMMVSVLS